MQAKELLLSVNLSIFDDQLLIWMREQNWTAAGANHICENTKQSFILFPKENQITDTGFQTYLYLYMKYLLVILTCINVLPKTTTEV